MKKEPTSLEIVIYMIGGLIFYALVFYYLFYT